MSLTEARKQALAALLDDPSPTVNTAVFKEIRHHGEAGLAMLREIAEGNDPRQAGIAAVWLRELGGNNYTEAFLDFIESFRYELETGCLLLDRTVFPTLDTTIFARFMNEVAKRCRDLLLLPASGYEICKVINRVLFHEYGFRGDVEHYYNPLNSFLHQVILRRRGIPISLSVLYLLIADRCGLQLEPIALPGHFLVGCFTDDEPFYVDAYMRGAIRTQDDLENYLYQHHIAPRADFFKPAPTGEVLCRFCRNLANQYAREHNEERARFFMGFVRAFEDAYKNHAEHG